MRGGSKPRWFCLGPLAATQISTLLSIRDHLEERHGVDFIFLQGAGEEEVARKPTLGALCSRILYQARRRFQKKAQVGFTPKRSHQVWLLFFLGRGIPSVVCTSDADMTPNSHPHSTLLRQGPTISLVGSTQIEENTLGISLWQQQVHAPLRSHIQEVSPVQRSTVLG